jgi:tetratricopeptide (TPR) repeat protein
MLRDAQGHRLSGATSEAVSPYDAAVRAYGLAYGDALGLFDKAREAAPEFAMAHIGKAWVLALANDAAFAAAARPLIETARALPLNEREQAHLAAVSYAAEGQRASGVAILDRHLMSYPRDILAHFAAMLMDGFLGRFPFVADRSARALPQWGKSDPGYGILLAFYGFGLEEAADYARSEATSREAAELEPYGYWPHHAVSHVMEMMGRPDDGLAWMDAREPLWSTEAHTAKTHVWWHKALFHVELGQYDTALAVYDGPLVATQRPVGLSLTNASALLWRLEMLGCRADGRWAKEARHWQDRADGKICVFTDIHAAMAELGVDDLAAVERRLTAMRATAADGTERAAVYRDIGLPVVQGLAAYRRGAHAEAVEHLLPARFDLWKMGGSKAQRDVVDWTLTEAATRAGLRDIALSLSHERLAARPASAPNRRFLEQAEAIIA